MCGIAGIISLNNSKIDPIVIENVKRSLEHRGPDHSSHNSINDSICLIHTRLSIIDLNDPFKSAFSISR
jgi:asparagine synthetase B (glutamine-hydrolysing)